MDREGRVRRNPSYDGICFHAQQCAEKYLKARLCAAGVDPGRTHDLVTLMEQSLPFEPLWEAFRKDLAYLSDFAIAYRYPGAAWLLPGQATTAVNGSGRTRPWPVRHGPNRCPHRA